LFEGVGKICSSVYRDAHVRDFSFASKVIFPYNREISSCSITVLASGLIT